MFNSNQQFCQRIVGNGKLLSWLSFLPSFARDVFLSNLINLTTLPTLDADRVSWLWATNSFVPFIIGAKRTMNLLHFNITWLDGSHIACRLKLVRSDLVVVSRSSKLAGVPKTQDLKETKIKTENERRNWENEKKMVRTQMKSAPLKKET